MESNVVTSGTYSPGSTSDISYQRYNNVNLKKLNSFLNNPRKSYKTKSGNAKTNIFIQKGSSYIIPDSEFPEFFDLYERCRKDNLILNYQEKQGTEDNPYTGIMLDFDCLIRDESFGEQKNNYRKLIHYILSNHIIKHLDNIHGKNVYAFIIERPHTTKKEATYKTGFHILFPSIKVSRAYKRFLIQCLLDDNQVITVLKNMGIINDLTALDVNSAHVPTFLFGSCKIGGVIYKLHSTYEVNLDDPLSFTDININNLINYNLAWELSLNFQAKYQSSGPLLSKDIYEVNSKYEYDINKYSNIILGPQTRDLHSITENEVEELVNTSNRARITKSLLDIISKEDPSYFIHFNKWRNIIFALANTSKNFYPLAKYFSQQCPEKYDEFKLKELWDYSITNRYEQNLIRPLTINSLKYLAKQLNEVEYKKQIEGDAFTKLNDYVHKYGGYIEHNHIANILAILFGHKFIVDEDPSSRGYSWFEFIMPGDHLEEGELWKWRERRKPLDLFDYISEGFEEICDQVRDDLERRIQQCESDDTGKSLVKKLNRFLMSSRSIFQHGFKTGVIKECEAKLYKHGFIKRLNRNGSLLGVSNGIVVLGKKCKIIEGYHEHLISKYTPVKAIPFDPEHFMIKEALRIIKEIIPEKDARLKLMMFWASCLDGYPKDPEMFIGTGIGSNAKTTLLKMIKNTFGLEYGLELPASLLLQEAPSADKPNSAIASMEDKRASFIEELDKNKTMCSSMLKKLVNPGDISNRDLNSRQKQFKITCKITMMTNFRPRIDIKDPATKRRIFTYCFKKIFKNNPNKDSKYECKGDPRIVKEYPDNPEFQSAILAILIHFYEVLYTCYDGNLKKVPSPTIDRETEEFFNEFDFFAQFVKDRIVYSPDYSQQYLLSNIASMYKSWLIEIEMFSKTQLESSTEIIKEIQESITLGKHVTRLDNGNLALNNCRILTKDDINLQPNEQYISYSKQLEYQGVQLACDQPEEYDWWNPEEYQKIINDIKTHQEANKLKLDNETSVHDYVLLQAQESFKEKRDNNVVNSFLSDL